MEKMIEWYQRYKLHSKLYSVHACASCTVLREVLTGCANRYPPELEPSRQNLQFDVDLELLYFWCAHGYECRYM